MKRRTKNRICSLFKHTILRPKEFGGSDVSYGVITLVTMKACWCRKVMNMTSEHIYLADNSGS